MARIAALYQITVTRLNDDKIVFDTPSFLRASAALRNFAKIPSTEIVWSVYDEDMILIYETLASVSIMGGLHCECGQCE